MSRRDRQRRRNRSKGGPGRIVLLALGVLVATLAIGVLSAVGYVISIANGAPDLDSLKAKDQGQNSIIYAADGKQLGVIESSTLRRTIPSSSIPQSLKDATVAIEDKRFYDHKGVDFEGVVRAAIKNAESGGTVQGGSTLTMQLIKNVYSQDSRRDYKRKIREAKMAEELEDRHPGARGKQWILVKYVNNVPYGNAPGGQEVVGIWAAARVYFNKQPRDLTLEESALLAGLPQAPTSYNPRLHPAAAIKRRNEVLAQMRDSGYITAAQETAAAGKPLGLESTRYYTHRRENYFFDYVRAELIRTYGAAKVRAGGLKVSTTIDLRLQKLARAAIRKNLAAPGSPSSALATVDPRTGYIRAMASSSNYGSSKFNLAAQGRRQPGSTFKIIVLMTAIRRGVDINRTSYVSHKLKFTDPIYGPIDVSNSDGAESGKAKSLFQAVVTSDNTVFQQLDLDLGPPNVTKTARDMGITAKLNSYPAEALGGLEEGVSPLEMARAYASVNNGGSRVKPIAVTSVRFADGTVDRKMGRVRKTKVFTDGMTHEAIQAMKGNITSGTGTAARLSDCVAAGKTGTTSGFKDAWFDGMTRDLNTAVWVGYPGPQGKAMDAVPGWGTMFGGKAPASIWHDYMTDAVKGTQCADWPEPKVPFVAQPFFGRLFRERGGAEPDATQTPSGAAGTGAGGGLTPGAGSTPGGAASPGGAYPPGAYESPPQGAPASPGTAGGGTAGAGGTPTTP